MNRRYLLASAAVLIMTAAVMPKPAHVPDDVQPSIRTTCIANAECEPIVPDQTVDPVSIPNLPDCEDEDQIVPACVWDARKHGNGQGMSWMIDQDMKFWVINHA